MTIERSEAAQAQQDKYTQQRQVVQITNNGADSIYALCNDGTIWELYGSRWIKQLSIPQPGDTP